MLARLLAKCLNARLVLDPVRDNPFLPRFLEDPASSALPAQISLLLSRYKQQGEIAQPDLFQQTTLLDYTLTADEVLASVMLTPEEYSLYLRLQTILAKSFVLPDLVLFLRAKPEVLSRRLGNDDPLRSIERARLETIVEAYNQRFDSFESAPLLTIEMDELDPGHEAIDIERLLKEIEGMGRGRVIEVPRRPL
jgi:deoxyadenosine/deoxycytidine kinase